LYDDVWIKKVFLLGLIGVTMMCANFFALKLTPCSTYSGRKYRWKFGQFMGTLLIFAARKWVFTGTARVKVRVFTGILIHSMLVIASYTTQRLLIFGAKPNSCI
jgi:hypothetical protein